MDFKKELKKIDLAKLLIGIVIGSIGGFSYYYFIGCSSGSCPITSNPYLMTVYGMFFGVVLFFKKKKVSEKIENEQKEI